MSYLLLASFLFLLPSLIHSSTSPEGTWTYIDGSDYGPMYLCLGADNKTILTGVYSEYGYVRGTFFKPTRTVTGKWFEVGLLTDSGMPTIGSFEWTFDSTYSSFTGSFYFDGQDPSDSQEWSESRIDDVTPSNIQCFRHSNTDSSLIGKWEWAESTILIYQSGLGTISSDYNGSVVNEASPSYSEGSCDTFYQTCRGQIQRTDYYGQIMFVLGRSDLIYITAFEGSWSDNNLNIPPQLNGNHLYTNASLVGSVTEADAAQNQVILFQGSFIDTPVQTSSLFFPFVTNVGAGVNVEGYYFQSSVVRGTYDWMTRTLSGLFFDPGLEYPNDVYTTGTFELIMNENWGSIYGSYSNYYVGETEPYSTDEWGPFYRVSFDLPSNSAALSDMSQPSTPITGYYSGDWNIYICATDNSFNASFFIKSTGQTGYAVGRCGPQYKVCNGDFISSSQRGQLLITVLTDTTIQIDFYYATFLDLPEPTLRNSVTLEVVTNDVTSSQCAMNLYLPFVGNFTDPIYGYTYYIAYDSVGQLLNGFYSEIGVTRGPINSDTGKWEARWVEPGLVYENTTNPTSGYVFFQMVSLDSFDGTFYFDNDLTRELKWGLVNKISYKSPTNTQAWVSTAYNMPLNGTWYNTNREKIWFCEYIGVSDPNLNHPYYMAYSWNLTTNGPLTHGFSEGACSYQTRICQGTWQSDNGSSGVLVLSLADQSNLRVSTFTGGMNANTSFQVVNSSLHRVTTYSRLISFASDEECHQYDGVAGVSVGFVSLIACVLATLLW